jgi:hypothetical protein
MTNLDNIISRVYSNDADDILSVNLKPRGRLK